MKYIFLFLVIKKTPQQLNYIYSTHKFQSSINMQIASILCSYSIHQDTANEVKDLKAPIKRVRGEKNRWQAIRMLATLINYFA